MTASGAIVPGSAAGPPGLQVAKVCHVVRRIVPSHWGGMEEHVTNLVQAHMQRGIPSEILSTSMLAEPGSDEVRGVPVRRFPYVFPWIGLDAQARRRLALCGGNPLSLPLLTALLRVPDLSLIHSHLVGRLAGAARVVARIRGIPYIVTLHGGYATLPHEAGLRMLEPVRGKWEWGKAFGFLVGARRVLDDADAVICVGRDEFEVLRDRFGAEKVFYIPPGVDVGRFATADGRMFRAAFALAEHERILLCVARLDESKNHLLLLEAFARLRREQPEWRLVLIGADVAPQYSDRVRAAIGRLGIVDAVTLIPGLEPDNPLLPSAYAAADAFVLPSRHEAFGIVVLEAWAAGVPVIASRVGGIPGFARDGRDALLFDPDDVDCLAALLQRVAREADLRAAMIRSARERVCEFDRASIANDVLGIYRAVLVRRANAKRRTALFGAGRR